MTYVDVKATMETLLVPLIARIRKLEQGTYQPPVVNADPAVLVDGMIWYRQDLGQHRVRQGGVTKTITAT